MSNETNPRDTCLYFIIFSSWATSNRHPLDDVGLQKSKLVFLLHNIEIKRYILKRDRELLFYIDKKNRSSKEYSHKQILLEKGLHNYNIV